MVQICAFASLKCLSVRLTVANALLLIILLTVSMTLLVMSLVLPVPKLIGWGSVALESRVQVVTVLRRL